MPGWPSAPWMVTVGRLVILAVVMSLLRISSLPSSKAEVRCPPEMLVRCGFWRSLGNYGPSSNATRPPPNFQNRTLRPRPILPLLLLRHFFMHRIHNGRIKQGRRRARRESAVLIAKNCTARGTSSCLSSRCVFFYVLAYSSYADNDAAAIKAASSPMCRAMHSGK